MKKQELIKITKKEIELYAQDYIRDGWQPHTDQYTSDDFCYSGYYATEICDSLDIDNDAFTTDTDERYLDIVREALEDKIYEIYINKNQ